MCQRSVIKQATGAVERSARAAGMNVNTAEQYALRLLNRAQPVLPVDQAAMPIDDFRIGDRVWVGGTKPGIIVYIGEVHFGTGEWAGVVLDTATGKNDGTVNGRRYFMCEAKRGVFSRLNKLTRSPVMGTSSLGTVSDDPAAVPATTRPTSSSGSRSSAAAAAAAAGIMSTVRSASPALMESRSLTLDIERRTGTNAPSPRGSGLLVPDENHKNISSSTFSPNGSETLCPRPTHGSGSSSPRRASVDSNHSSQNANAMSSTAVPSAAASSSALLADDNAAESILFNVGDRVVVNKKKLGTVKYVGTTDFSSGLWAGVELDEPVGKNDGCVAGTRYFNCKPLYGLFTPIHKLTPLIASTPQVIDRNGMDMASSPLVHRPMQPNDVRSVSVPVAALHISSPPVTSQLHGSKTRKYAYNGPHVATDDRRDGGGGGGGQGSSQQINSTNNSVVAEAGEQSLAVPSADSSSFKTENEEISRRLRQYIEKLEKDKTEVHHLLQEEKRKAEDLQFTLEESSIEKSELEAEFEKKLGQIRELEGKLQKEAELTNRLSHELAAVKTTASGENIKVTTTSLNTDQVDDLLDQIEELTHKLSRAETKIRALESSNTSTNVKNASEYETAKQQAEEQIIRLREELKKTVTEKKLVEKQLADVLEKSNADNLKMASEIEKLTAEKKRLIAENDRTVSELGNTQKRLVEADHLLKEFKDTVDHIEQAHSMQITKYCNHIEALKAEMDSLQQAQKQLASYKQQVEKLAEKVDVLSDERESLKKQVETLQSSLNSHRELETEYASCQANLQLLHNKFGQTVKEFEYEKNKLADIVETAKKSLNHKDKQIEQLRDEISRLKKVEQTNTAVATQELTKSLHLVEAQNSVKVAAVTAEEQSLSTAIAEKEEALSKVDFLNSVIMEIQRKNMELEAWKRRHELFAAGGNGESNVATTATPLQQRLYCDICNIYDQHDTEDCPQQGM